MKLLILSTVLFLSATFISCSSNDITNEISNQDNKYIDLNSRSTMCSMLSFKSLEEYNILLDSLSYLSDKELLAWEATQDNFKSLYHVHSDALEQILNVKTEEEYYKIKEYYKKYLLFNNMDRTDLSAYLPVMTICKAITLNPEGNIEIAGEIINMREYSNFNDYNRVLSQYRLVQTRNTIENGVI